MKPSPTANWGTTRKLTQPSDGQSWLFASGSERFRRPQFTNPSRTFFGRTILWNTNKLYFCQNPVSKVRVGGPSRKESKMCNKITVGWVPARPEWQKVSRVLVASPSLLRNIHPTRNLKSLKCLQSCCWLLLLHYFMADGKFQGVKRPIKRWRCGCSWVDRRRLPRPWGWGVDADTPSKTTEAKKRSLNTG